MTNKPRIDFGRLPKDNATLARPNPTKMNDVGDAAGFLSREVPVQKYRRTPNKEPQTSMTLRWSVTAHNKFVQFCDDERLSSYAAGVQELMKRAGLDEE